MNSRLGAAKPHCIVGILMAGYVTLALYLAVFLRHDFLRSDVLGYWQDSLAWRTPFHPFQVPAYPLMIASLRGLTFDVLPSIALMMSINIVAFVTSLLLIYRIVQRCGANEGSAALGTFLFGLFPFVGLTYAVVPLADVPAMSFFLGGLYLLQRSHSIPAALPFGLSLVTHKDMWSFVEFVVMSDFF